MTGISKPHQLGAAGALRMFEDIVRKEEDLQQSYMTIYRPRCDSDDEVRKIEAGVNCTPRLTDLSHFTQSSVSSAAPSAYPNTSAGTAGDADSRAPTRAVSVFGTSFLN